MAVPVISRGMCVRDFTAVVSMSNARITRKLPAQAATNRAKQIRFRRRKLRNMRPNLPISNFLSKAVIDQFPYLGCGTLGSEQRTCCTEEAEVILSAGRIQTAPVTSREATFDSVLRRSGSRPKRRTGFRLATSVRHTDAAKVVQVAGW